MRTILFRGKEKDTGEWVEGSYLQSGFIVTDERLVIDPDKGDSFLGNMHAVEGKTVTAYTNMDTFDLSAKTNSEYKSQHIYFGDIVKITLHSGTASTYLLWENTEGFVPTVIDLQDISYNGIDYFSFSSNWSWGDFVSLYMDVWGDALKVEVVGNVFDNKDMINLALEERGAFLGGNF